MAAFFVPMVDADKQEEAYQQMAEFVGAQPAAAGNRIQSITWKHGNTIWSATVGETLRGVETITKGRGRDKRYFEVPCSTSDTVLAIYSGAPFMIVHDNHSRVWNLPIYANPTAVRDFRG